MGVDAQFGWRDRLITRVEWPSRLDMIAAVLVALALPPLAAFLQSSWIWFAIEHGIYRPVFHWDNMSTHQFWLLWSVQSPIAAAVLWVLMKYAYLQRMTATLLLGIFVAYDFFINKATIRW